jgi:tRNA1Val (adenine37-N6)-methyltransferase
VANNFFQFKQFIVYQQHCAMKVSTDSCIFGAAVAAFFADTPGQSDTGKCYLDIGTGTGLLSLMLAQQTTAAIDAVEIDNAAFEQASQNLSTSPFSKQLKAYYTDALQFEPGKKYDGILCNPPFFEGDLQSDNALKNAAKHSTTFTLLQLLTTAERLLTTDGVLAVLLPYHRVNTFIQSANELQFYLQQQILMRHTTTHPYFRGILFLSRQQSTVHTKELVIKNEANTYTDAFIDLLKDYYLQL